MADENKGGAQSGPKKVPDPAAPKQPDKKPPEVTEPQAGATLRVVRSLPNPSNSHNGVTFATVKLGERTLHVSERVSQEVADNFCRVTGYSLFDGDEAEHARAIEDALAEARKVVPVGGGQTAADRSLADQLAEQQRINGRQSEVITGLREQIATQADRIKALEAENEALKQSGARTSL